MPTTICTEIVSVQTAYPEKGERDEEIFNADLTFLLGLLVCNGCPGNLAMLSVMQKLITIHRISVVRIMVTIDTLLSGEFFQIVV